MWLFSFAAIPGAELVQLQVHFLQMQTDQLLTSRDPATNFGMLIYLLSMIFIYYLQKQFEVIIKYVFLDEDFDSILIFNLDSETLGGGRQAAVRKRRIKMQMPSSSSFVWVQLRHLKILLCKMYRVQRCKIRISCTFLCCRSANLSFVPDMLHDFDNSWPTNYSMTFQITFLML